MQRVKIFFDLKKQKKEGALPPPFANLNEWKLLDMALGADLRLRVESSQEQSNARDAMNVVAARAFNGAGGTEDPGKSRIRRQLITGRKGCKVVHRNTNRMVIRHVRAKKSERIGDNGTRTAAGLTCAAIVRQRIDSGCTIMAGHASAGDTAEFCRHSLE